MSDLRRLRILLRPYRGRIGCTAALAVAATAIELWLELLIRPLVDDGILRGNLSAFLRILGLQVACYLAAMGLNAAHVRSYMGLSADIARELRILVFGRAQKLPLAYFCAENAAALPTRIAVETGGVASALGETLGATGVAVLQAIAAALVLVRLEWRLALVALVLLPLHAWFARRAGLAGERLQRDYYAIQDNILRFLHERLSFAAQPVFSDPASRDAAGRRFAAEAACMRDTGYNLGVLPHTLSLTSYALSILSTLFVYAAGGYLVMRGEISLGVLLTFFAVKSFLERPLLALASNHVTFREALAHWKRLAEVLDYPAADTQTGTPFFHDSMALEAVAFGYDGKSVLKGISATLPKGKFIVLVGPTGAGKTTLLLLLQKHLAPQAGRILLGDQDSRIVSTDSLRRATAYLGQEPVLVSGTLRENLSLHVPEAGDEDLREACRLAGLAEFLAGLPDGLDTEIADGGASLSGGEKQRVGLARALLKRPALLLLDEPTSALDERTEEAICGTLRRLTKERGVTVVAATHRRAVLESADLVFRVNDGRLEAGGAG